MPSSSARRESSGPWACGRTWRTRIRQWPAPRERAASTEPDRQTRSVSALVTRAKFATVDRPTVMATLTVPEPSAAIRAREEQRGDGEQDAEAAHGDLAVPATQEAGAEAQGATAEQAQRDGDAGRGEREPGSVDDTSE